MTAPATCGECSKAFTPRSPRYRGTYKYCSKRCHLERNKRMARRVRTPRLVVCVVCQDEFSTEHRQQMYCSKACYLRAGYIRRHGITVYEYNALIEQQGGVCGACGDAFDDEVTPHIDHCHATGVVRGVLHPGCNVAVGMLGESYERAEAIARYLRGFRP